MGLESYYGIVILAALDSYQTHTHTIHSLLSIHTVCTSVSTCLTHSFTPTCPPHSMVHHLTDQLPPVMVEENAVIVTETAKYVPSPVLSMFTSPHEAGHSTALLGYARLTYRLCSRPYPLSVLPVLCSIDIITAASPTVVVSSLQPHPQWWYHHCSPTHSGGTITAAPPTVVVSSLQPHPQWWYHHCSPTHSGGIITAAPPTVVVPSLQPHPQWWYHHCSPTHSGGTITAAPPTVVISSLQPHPQW